MKTQTTSRILALTKNILEKAPVTIISKIKVTVQQYKIDIASTSVNQRENMKML